jgi:hypothetical protein
MSLPRRDYEDDLHAEASPIHIEYLDCRGIDIGCGRSEGFLRGTRTD